MFRCLEYTAFLWKAKGRHGTHSPFAYWLADVVARQNQFEKHKAFKDISSKKTRDFLNKLHHCLPDYSVFISKKKEDLQSEIHHENEPCLYILEPDLLLFFLESFKLNLPHPDSIFVILEPHITRNQSIWQTLIHIPELHFSADCFNFGLLSLRPGQAKEHFYLKLG